MEPFTPNDILAAWREGHMDDREAMRLARIDTLSALYDAAQLSGIEIRSKLHDFQESQIGLVAEFIQEATAASYGTARPVDPIILDSGPLISLAQPGSVVLRARADNPQRRPHHRVDRSAISRLNTNWLADHERAPTSRPRLISAGSRRRVLQSKALRQLIE